MDLNSKLKETCPVCGKNTYKKVTILGTDRVVKTMCKCESKAWHEKKEHEEAAEKQERLKKLISNSLMDDKFRESTFENWDFERGSRKMYELGKRYAENFKECKKQGLGLLIYGNAGNGKTYMASCIANELLKRYVPVICISINGLLGRIQKTYNNYGKEAESDILRTFSNADLLIIDDLGTEKSSEWSRSMVYNIIDSRYRSKLPLIITSNLDIKANERYGVLEELYHERTESRILEMCTPVFNTSKSIRLEEAKKKTELLKKILY